MNEKLDPEFKERWIVALRSGQYQQGRRALCENFGGENFYCCLGVAYVVAKGVNPPDTISGYIEGRYKIGSMLVIDTEGVPALLVGNGANHSPDSDIRKALTEMNDDGKSFSDIADYIEANL